jgi:hypothetical protein
MKLEKIVSTTFLIALLTVVLFVGVWQIKPAQGTAIFSDNFSSGTFAAWGGSSTSAGCTQFANDSVIYKSAPYGANATIDGDTWWDYAFQYKEIDAFPPDLSEVYIRAYSRWTANPTTSNVGYHTILKVDTKNSSADWGLSNVVFKVQNIANNARWQIEYLKDGATAVWNDTANLSINTWYCWEVYIKIGDSTGNVTLVIDGVQTRTDEGFDNLVDAKYLYRIKVGMCENYKDAVTMFWDDLVVADTYIGTLAPSQSPTFSNVGTNGTTLAGNPCQFRTQWADDSGLSGFIFGSNNTGIWTNNTWTSSFSDGFWSYAVKTLNDTAANVVQWEFWANDTDNQWTGTGLQNLTITSPPAEYTASVIQDLIDTASVNSTVTLPAGTYYFYGDTVTISKSLTLDGSNSTFQQVHDGSFGKMIEVTGTSNVNITHINFIGNVTGDDNVAPATGISLSSIHDFHISYCNFTDFPNTAIGCTGSSTIGTTGLIDYCRIDNPYKEVVGGQWAYGIIVWSTDYWDWDSEITHYLGQYESINSSYTVVYIENNFINRTRHAIASNQNGWYVVRFNNLSQINNNYVVDVHSPSTTASGGRGLECYNNTIDCNYAQNSYGIGMRGGSGVIYNNTLKELTTGIRVTKDGLSGTPFRPLNDLWIWSNTFEGVTTTFQNYDGYYVENTDYFLRAPTQALDGFTYTPYPYPHYLAGGTFAVGITIVSPTNTTYSSSSISVSLAASGGTIDTIWWNCKNGSSWIYGSNQTYTVPTDMTGFTVGTSYTFYAWANNTDGNSDEETVMFTVQIETFASITTQWGGYWGRWWGYP